MPFTLWFKVNTILVLFWNLNSSNLQVLQCMLFLPQDLLTWSQVNFFFFFWGGQASSLMLKFCLVFFLMVYFSYFSFSGIFHSYLLSKVISEVTLTRTQSWNFTHKVDNRSPSGTRIHCLSIRPGEQARQVRACREPSTNHKDL